MVPTVFICTRPPAPSRAAEAKSFGSTSTSRPLVPMGKICVTVCSCRSAGVLESLNAKSCRHFLQPRGCPAAAMPGSSFCRGLVQGVRDAPAVLGGLLRDGSRGPADHLELDAGLGTG